MVAQLLMLANGILLGMVSPLLMLADSIPKKYLWHGFSFVNAG